MTHSRRWHVAGYATVLLAWTIELAHLLPPEMEWGGDAFHYLYVAQAILAGRSPFLAPERLPLLPYLEAGAIHLGFDGLLSARLLNLLAGTLSVALVPSVARLLGARRWEGLAGAALLATHALYTLTSVAPIADVLYTSQYLLVLWLYARLLRRPRSLWRGLALGIALVVTALTRHEGLVVAALVASLVGVQFVRRKLAGTVVLSSLAPAVLAGMLLLPLGAADYFLGERGLAWRARNVVSYEETTPTSNLRSMGRFATELWQPATDYLPERGLTGSRVRSVQSVIVPLSLAAIGMGLFRSALRRRPGGEAVLAVAAVHFLINLMVIAWYRHLSHQLPLLFIWLAMGLGEGVARSRGALRQPARVVATAGVTLLAAWSLLVTLPSHAAKLRATRAGSAPIVQAFRFAGGLQGRVAVELEDWDPVGGYLYGRAIAPTCDGGPCTPEEQWSFLVEEGVCLAVWTSRGSGLEVVREGEYSERFRRLARFEEAVDPASALANGRSVIPGEVQETLATARQPDADPYRIEAELMPAELLAASFGPGTGAGLQLWTGDPRGELIRLITAASDGSAMIHLQKMAAGELVDQRSLPLETPSPDLELAIGYFRDGALAVGFARTTGDWMEVGRVDFWREPPLLAGLVVPDGAVVQELPAIRRLGLAVPDRARTVAEVWQRRDCGPDG